MTFTLLALLATSLSCLFNADLLFLAGVNGVAFRVNGINFKIFPSERIAKITMKNNGYFKSFLKLGGFQ